MGLRGRIALALAGTAMLVAAVIGMLVHVRTASGQLDRARAAFDERFRTLLERQAEGQDAGLRVGAAGVPEPLLHQVATQPVRATYLDDGTLWAATTLNGEVVSLSRSYAAELAELATLDQILVGSGAAAALVASLAGLLVAGGLSRRIRAVARTATAVAGGDLTARVFPASSGPLKPTGPGTARPEAGRSGGGRWFFRGGSRSGERSSCRDEVEAVGRALDMMTDTLRSRLEAERRVTADIAHELRTPVAGLVTAAELLPPGRPTELVRDRAAVLRRLVEDVLEVSRLDAHAEQPALERRQVSVLARRAIAALAPHTGIEPEGGLQTGVKGVRLEVIRDAEVETDPRRVERILGNLVSNGLRHGAPPVTVTVDGPVVTVADSGAGFPDDLLTGLREHGPRRFATGATSRGTGVGLGLTIAVGQARLLGAELEFGNTGTGGAAVLRLP